MTDRRMRAAASAAGAVILIGVGIGAKDWGVCAIGAMVALGSIGLFRPAKDTHMEDGYVIVISRGGWETRLPSLGDPETARNVADALTMAYPDDLIEIAHNGMRS